MNFTSPYKPAEIKEILYEQVDKFPSFIRCLITLNAHYFTGTSPVCGNVTDSGFELRNRKGPYWSLRVKGFFSEIDSGTNISISFSKPLFPDLLGFIFNRYKDDEKVVINFLQRWIKIKDIAEQSASRER